MNAFSGKKVLITGINGFIGLHLAHTLTSLGATVEGTSRDPNAMHYLHGAGAEKKYVVHSLDLQDESPIQRVIEKGKYAYVFHLASQSDTWKSIHAPHETMKINVMGTLNLLEAIRKNGDRPRVIVAGTVRAFYDHEMGSSTGMHPYDASKLGMESIAASYFHAYNIPGAIARNTNVYGPNDLNFSRLIPLIMKQGFTTGRIQLKGDGELKRDFMYVGDAVDGMIALASQLDKPEVNGRAFTFATGKLTSIREVCEEMQHHIVPHPSVHFDEKETLVDRNQPKLNVKHTSTVLGWESKVSFSDGIRKTAEWYSHYFQKGRK